MKSKRIIAFAAAAAMTASVMPASVSAYDALPEYIGELNTAAETTPAAEEELPLFNSTEYTEGDFTYTVENGYAEITKYNGTARSVTIPKTLGGYTVNSIGRNAFHGNGRLTTLTIGSNITNIGSGAFSYCTALEEVIIPDSVSSMGKYAFEECSSMEKAVIGKGLKTIPSSAFKLCTRLSDVTIGENVTTIETSAFFRTGIKGTLYIPDSVTYIYYSAFEDCDNITAIRFGTNLRTLEYTVFRDCDGLTSVTLPDSVTTIGNNLFSDCQSLKKITFGSGLTYTGNRTCENCPSLTDIVLPSSVNTISRYSFYKCTGLKKYVVPDTVKHIQEYAFANCESLTDITFGSGVEDMGRNAFFCCSALTDVVIPDTMLEISGTQPFAGCYGLRSIVFGKELVYVCNSAAESCKKLTDVIIKEGVKRINTDAFSECESLKRIYIPSTLNTIGMQAFFNYDNPNTTVFYGGSKADWEDITFEYGNDNIKYSTVYYDCPEPVSITSLKMSNGAPTLSWTASSGAGAYRIYRTEDLKGDLKYLGSVKTRTFADTTAAAGKTYFYFVVALKDSDSFSYSAPKSITVTQTVTAPAAPKVTVTAGANSASVKWNAVSGATAYRVFYRLNGTSKWTYKNTTKTAMSLTGLTAGKKYDILVRAYNGNNKTWSKYTSANILTVTPTKALAKPVITSATAGVNRAAVRWNAVSGAKSYRIYYRVKGTSTWTCKNTTQTVSVLTSLTGGKTYEVVIRATDGNGWSAASAVKTVTPTKA